MFSSPNKRSLDRQKADKVARLFSRTAHTQRGGGWGGIPPPLLLYFCRIISSSLWRPLECKTEALLASLHFPFSPFYIWPQSKSSQQRERENEGKRERDSVCVCVCVCVCVWERECAFWVRGFSLGGSCLKFVVDLKEVAVALLYLKRLTFRHKRK